MKLHAISLGLAAASILLACGGGGGDSPSPSTTAVTAVPTASVVVPPNPAAAASNPVVVVSDTPDTTAPSAPAAFTASSSTSDSISIGWLASTDNVGIIGYEVWRNGTRLQATPANQTTIQDNGLTPGTTYTYTVRAVDASGNSSAFSTSLNVRTQIITSPVDTTPPSAPAALAASQVTASSLTISWGPSTDNAGVVRYEVYRNGTILVGSTAQTFFVLTGLTASTTYSLTIKAFDAAGNASVTSITVVVSTAAAPATPAPDATAPSVPTGLAVTQNTSSSLSLNWAPSTDNAGVVGYEVLLNGNVVGSSTTLGYIYTGLTAATSYTLRVRAQDAAGNKSAASTPLVASTLNAVAPPDTTAPSTPTGLVLSNPTASSLKLSWTASTDNVAVTGYALFINGVQVGSTTNTSFTFTGLNAATAYSLSVKALDAQGNVSPSSAPLAGSTTSGSGFAITPTVSGLGSGTTIVLQNGADTLTFASNTSASFATKLATGASYAVTVKTYPAGQSCTVTNGNGTMGSANVTNTLVSCIATTVTTLYFADFESGELSAAGQTIGAQLGGSVGVSSDKAKNHGGSNGSLKATYPMATAGMYAWASFDLAPFNTRDVYIEFDVKVPPDSGARTPGSAKFLKFFGQNANGYANTTFGLSGDAGQVGSLTYIGFGDGNGNNTENDVGNVILLNGDYPNWIGRSYGNATVYNKGANWNSADWKDQWHHFRVHAKFHTSVYNYTTNTCVSETNDGEYYLEIDGVVYVNAKGLFNHHCSNLPFDHVNLLDWGGGTFGPFEINLDNIRITTGGFLSSPTKP